MGDPASQEANRPPAPSGDIVRVLDSYISDAKLQGDDEGRDDAAVFRRARAEILRLREELAWWGRKAAHGCIDAKCEECDR